MNKKNKKIEISSILENMYMNHRKKLLFFPMILLILSFVTISLAIQKDGTPIYRDISLKGGLSTIIEIEQTFSSQELQIKLEENNPDYSFRVVDLIMNSRNAGYVIDTDLEEEKFMASFEEITGTKLEYDVNYNSNYISPSLSLAFFKQAIIILIISFLLMSTVIFLYFREIIPSVAVIVSAIFDIVVTIGILNLFGINLSIAGVGALLMIIGYSIDTDVLLANRLLKEKNNEDSNVQKVINAQYTGTLMSLTTLAAGVAALILTNSTIIAEIAIILIIGLLVDYISTWFQNTVILLSWLEKKEKNHKN